MSQIGRELQLSLQAAFREAHHRRHAYLTVEHLLFALVPPTPVGLQQDRELTVGEVGDAAPTVEPRRPDLGPEPGDAMVIE